MNNYKSNLHPTRKKFQKVAVDGRHYAQLVLLQTRIKYDNKLRHIPKHRKVKVLADSRVWPRKTVPQLEQLSASQPKTTKPYNKPTDEP